MYVIICNKSVSHTTVWNCVVKQSTIRCTRHRMTHTYTTLQSLLQSDVMNTSMSAAGHLAYFAELYFSAKLFKYAVLHTVFNNLSLFMISTSIIHTKYSINFHIYKQIIWTNAISNIYIVRLENSVRWYAVLEIYRIRATQCHEPPSSRPIN